MIEEAGGRIDYEECGAGPTIVLVPGSCSTGAAWACTALRLCSPFTVSLRSPEKLGLPEMKCGRVHQAGGQAELLNRYVRHVAGPIG